MPNSFFQIGVVFILATFLGALVRFLKQPLILAYILAGLILGTFGATRLVSPEALDIFSQFGVAFLLFMVGLELKITDIRQIGKLALIVGLGQIILTFISGFLICLSLGFSTLLSVYIGLSLVFSSTVIVIKLLSEKNDLDSFYGRVTIGLLLVQDFVVILILMFLSGFKGGYQSSFLPFLFIFAKGLGLFLLVSFLAKKWIPFLFQAMARSQELLFLTAVAWCFLFASLSRLLGFSLEIGAFLAGVSLSSLPYHYQISSRIRPLRDLFITLFFVGLGMKMLWQPKLTFLIPALVLSVFILVGKPIIVFLLMSFLGFRKRVSFLTSISLAQISEFSFILMAMGYSLGHLTSEDVSKVTTVGVVTICASTYLIFGGRKIFQRVSRFLAFFEKEQIHEAGSRTARLPEDHIVLIGCNRTGEDILEFLKRKEVSYLVLDFNPEIIQQLEAQEIPCLFGDVSDEEILTQLNLEKAKIVISTVPSLEDNLFLVSWVKAKSAKVLVLVTASYPEEEEALYGAGADYVILPHLLGGKHVAHLLAEHADNLEEYLYSKRQKSPQ